MPQLYEGVEFAHNPLGLGPLFLYRPMRLSPGNMVSTSELPSFEFQPSVRSLFANYGLGSGRSRSTTGSTTFFLLVRAGRFSHIHLCMFVFPSAVTVVPASVLAWHLHRRRHCAGSLLGVHVSASLDATQRTPEVRNVGYAMSIQTPIAHVGMGLFRPRVSSRGTPSPFIQVLPGRPSCTS